jgi:hypothetical protein
MKRIIRLTEGDLHKIITRTLNESLLDDTQPMPNYVQNGQGEKARQACAITLEGLGQLEAMHCRLQIDPEVLQQVKNALKNMMRQAQVNKDYNNSSTQVQY